MKGSITAILLVSLAWRPGFAATIENGDEGLIQEILTRSSVDRQIESFPAFVQGALDTKPYASDKLLAIHVKQAFQADALRTALINQLKSRYDEKHFQGYLAQLKRPEIQKLMAQEAVVASDPQQYVELAAFVHNAPLETLSPERVELLSQLDRAAGATHFSVSTRMELLKVLTQLYILHQGPTTAGGHYEMAMDELSYVRQRLNEQLPAVVRPLVIKSAYFIYSPVSDEALKTYIDYYNTPSVHWFIKVWRESWIAAIREVGAETSETLRLAPQMIADTQSLN